MRSMKGQKITRREFIKTSSVIGASLAFGSRGALAEQLEEEKPKLSGSLRLRTLGRTKLEVTELSFGGGYLRDTAPLHMAIDMGVNLIHTAPGYAGGRSIEVFGEVMKTKREKVFLALKEAPVGDKVEKALKKLNTDYVDILVPPIHSVKAMVGNPKLGDAYERLKKEGKIRFSGFACHKNMADVMRKAIELGFFDVMLIRYNVENSAELDPILAEAKERQDMGFMAMKVVKPFQKEGQGRISEVISDTIKNRNVDTLLIGMANLDEVEANVSALSVKGT